MKGPLACLERRKNLSSAISYSIFRVLKWGEK
jgi:hypothetical protein